MCSTDHKGFLHFHARFRQVGKELTPDEQEALKAYLENFGDCRDGSNPGTRTTF